MTVGIAIGTPRGFSNEAKKEFKKQVKNRYFWVRHNNDIVTRVAPFLMGYRHGGDYIYQTALGDIKHETWWIHDFLDGIFGRAIDIFDLNYDAAEDHYPQYYVNNFAKACGSKRKLERWKND